MTSWLIVNASLFTEPGRFYLMMNFLMRIAMALLSSVMMESCAECFHAFSHTRQITQKSMFSFRSMASKARVHLLSGYFWLRFEIRVTAHAPDAWFPRLSFTVLALSLMLYSVYQVFVTTFGNVLQLHTTPSTRMAPQLKAHFQKCGLKPFHWYLLLYVVRSWYPQLLTIRFLQEHICWDTWTPGFRHLSCTHSGFTTWVWARSFQISVQAPPAAASCN